MKKVDIESKKYQTQKSDVYMEIIDEDNSKRKRYFNLYKKNFGGDTKSLIKFYEPSNIKNTSLLSYSYEDKENDQWFYFPALRTIKKLGVSDKNSSFMGSDFSNADIAGRSLNEYNYCFKSQDDRFYYVDSYPKSSGDQYSMLKIKVAKDINVVADIEFFDRSNQHIKTLKNQKIKEISGFFVVLSSKMINHKNSGYTRIITKKIELNDDINDSFFGVRNLR